MVKYLKYLLIACIVVWSTQIGSVLALSFNPYPTGTLVNDSGTIYFISGNDKVPFTSWQAFSGLGYSLQNVVQGDLTNYPLVQGYTINTANAAHPWGSWLIYQGTVYYVSQTGLIGVPSAQVFTSNGGDWQYIVRANQYDVQILNENPNQPVLQMNDPRVGSSTYNGIGGTGNLSLSVNSLNFTVTGVGSVPTSTQSFSVNPGSSTAAWTAQAQLGSIPGLNLFYGNALGAVVSGTGYASVGVSIVGPFTAGTFTSTVLVTSNGQSQAVSVTLTVAGGSSSLLQVSPSSLSFSAVAGGAAPSLQSLYINPGSSTAIWTAQLASGALPIFNLAYTNMGGAVVSGTGPATISISIGTPSTPGSYSTTVFVTSNFANGQPAQAVPVTLTVSSASYSSSPTIYSITPTNVPIGGSVNIYGSGFSNTTNTIEIDNLVATMYTYQPLPEVNGQGISFTVPSVLAPNCATGTACPQYIEQLQPGTHSLSVISNGVQSNSVTITITGTSGFVSPTPTPTPTPTFTSTTVPIISVSPSSGPSNVTVTLTATSGTLFTPSGNQVVVSGNTLAYLASANGQTLSLQLPGLTVGSHSIVVTNSNGTSNSVTYTVTQ